MLSLVLRTIREHHLLEGGDRVLVAVSGGPDSMALLAVLWEIHQRLGIALEVATVDHGLRPEARLEAELVAQRARDLGLAFHLVSVDVRAARGRGQPGAGGSLQEIARRLRLDGLADLARRRGANKIALGHQADDQAETILFRILRGTGVRGLRGIPYRRDSFVRPLLDVRRAQVLAYLRRRSIPFSEDPSNADPRFSRARLRHHVLPALRAENPRLVEALQALAADAARLLGAEGDSPAGAGGPPVGRRAALVVERWRRERRGTTRIDVEGGQIEISYGRIIRVKAGDAKPILTAASLRPVVITGPGEYGWAGSRTVAVREGAPVAGLALFDADAVARPLRLRSIRAGDRMRPRGGRGSRKISDLLIDAKISRHQRPGLPVLTTADDTILFVPGLRPAELGRPTAATSRWLSVSAGTTFVAD